MGVVRVLTYNMHHGKGSDGILDLPRIQNVLTDREVDLIGLNEVDCCFSKRSAFMDQGMWLAQHLHMDIVFTPSITLSNGGQYGNALLSRFPIYTHTNIVWPPTFSLFEGRSMVEAIVQLPEGCITVMVVHLSLGGLSRQRQIRTIRERVEHAAYPVIALGDWNMRPLTRDWRRMTEVLNDSWHERHASAGYTYPSRSPRRRLDYVFADRQFKICEAEVLHAHPRASDHLAVYVQMKRNEMDCGPLHP